MTRATTKRRRPLSLAAHVSLLVGITIVACLVALDYSVLRSISHHFAEQDAEELRVVAKAVERAYLQTDNPYDHSSLASHLDRAISGHHGVYFGVFDSTGKTIYLNHELSLAPLLDHTTTIERIGAAQLYPWRSDGHEYRGAVIAPPSLAQFDGGARIAVAVNMDFHHMFMDHFSDTLWIMMLVAGILTLIAAWVAIRFGLHPLHRISEEIKDINAEQLNRRLDAQHVPADLEELVQSFNGMISRVEKAFQQLSQFSADIAHELRTPITNLSTQTQVALSKPRSVDEYREILYSSLEEYNQLSAMIRDMLWLAQTDNNQLTLEKIPLDLLGEIQILVDYFEPWAEERQVNLRLSGSDITVDVDRHMFRRALNNLLSNAIKHSPGGEQVNITLKRQPGQAEICIENSGVAIEPEHLGRIFDRFYRIDPARGHRPGSDGVGLGLSITRSIIELHGGTITAQSGGDKTCFTILLPI